LLLSLPLSLPSGTSRKGNEHANNRGREGGRGERMEGGRNHPALKEEGKDGECIPVTTAAHHRDGTVK